MYVYVCVWASAWPKIVCVVLIINRCCHSIWINLQTHFHNSNAMLCVCVFCLFLACPPARIIEYYSIWELWFQGKMWIWICRIETEFTLLLLFALSLDHLHPFSSWPSFNSVNVAFEFFRNLFFPPTSSSL